MSEEKEMWIDDINKENPLLNLDNGLMILNRLSDECHSKASVSIAYALDLAIMKLSTIRPYLVETKTNAWHN